MEILLQKIAEDAVKNLNVYCFTNFIIQNSISTDLINHQDPCLLIIGITCPVNIIAEPYA
jgi:hypothetical protein